MFKPVRRYWKLYGGWRAFLTSPYLYTATILTALCYPIWATDSVKWPEITMAVMPSLMGFSVAGMTVLLAFSDSKSLRTITQKGKNDSYFVKTVANLFHFLFFQMIALFLAIIGKAFSSWVLSYFGVLALTYAIFVSIAAAGQLLNTAIIINKAVWAPDEQIERPDEALESQPPQGTA